MYAYLRLALLVVKNTFRKREVFDHTTSYVWTFRPGLADLDVYPEVNNGRHFVLFDLARYDLAMRTGLFRWVRKTRSAFVVAGSTIRYRHRLRPWRRTQVITDLVGMDDRFFYFQQRTVQSGRTCSVALLRTGVRRKGAIHPREVMEGMGLSIEPFMHPWVAEWNTWDDERPWPA